MIKSWQFYGSPPTFFEILLIWEIQKALSSSKVLRFSKEETSVESTGFSSQSGIDTVCMASGLFAQEHLSPRVTPEPSSSVAVCFIATQAIRPAVFTYLEPFKVSDLCSDNKGKSLTS